MAITFVGDVNKALEATKRSYEKGLIDKATYDKIISAGNVANKYGKSAYVGQGKNKGTTKVNTESLSNIGTMNGKPSPTNPQIEYLKGIGQLDSARTNAANTTPPASVAYTSPTTQQQTTTSPRATMPDITELFQRVLQTQQGQAESLFKQLLPQINADAERRGLYNSGIPLQLQSEGLENITARLMQDAFNQALQMAGLDLQTQGMNLEQYNADRTYDLSNKKFDWQKFMDNAGLQNEIFNNLLNLQKFGLDKDRFGLEQNRFGLEKDKFAFDKEITERETASNEAYRQALIEKMKAEAASKGINPDAVMALIRGIIEPVETGAMTAEQAKARLAMLLYSGMIDKSMYDLVEKITTSTEMARNTTPISDLSGSSNNSIIDRGVDAVGNIIDSIKSSLSGSSNNSIIDIGNIIDSIKSSVDNPPQTTTTTESQSQTNWYNPVSRSEIMDWLIEFLTKPTDKSIAPIQR